MPKKAAPPRPVATYDHLRKKAPLEQVVRIPLSEDAVADHRAATEALETVHKAVKRLEDAARADEEPSAALVAARAERDETERALKAATAALEAETAVLRFRSLGRPRYDALVRAHPPQDRPGEDGKPVKGTEPYDVETFAPALVAASCVEPKMTEAQVMALFDLGRLTQDELVDMASELEIDLSDVAPTHPELVEAVRAVAPEWNAAEVMELWIASLAVNTQRRVADFGNFSNGTRG